MFNNEDLSRLVAVDAAPAVSMFLPTQVAGREVRQNPIRLKNLLAIAADRLTAGGLRRPEAEALLAPAAKLIDDGAFWRQRDEGLALFIAGDLFEAHRVPLELEEEVVVSSSLAVRPLLPLLAADGGFLILAASAGGARLYAATRHGVVEEDAALPGGLQDVHEESDYDGNIQHAPGHMRHHDRRNVAATSVKTHNFGESPEELRRVQLIEYLRRLADAVGRHAAGRGFSGPLVLVADEEVQGHLRKELANAPLQVTTGVTANPDALEAAEMHRRAYALVEPLFDRDRLEAIGRFRALAADPEQAGRAQTKAVEVVQAAHDGRIDTLLVAGDARLFGHWNEDANRVDPSGSPDNGAIDLLEKATADTVLHGGVVHTVGRDALPPGCSVAAVTRW